MPRKATGKPPGRPRNDGRPAGSVKQGAPMSDAEKPTESATPPEAPKPNLDFVSSPEFAQAVAKATAEAIGPAMATALATQRSEMAMELAKMLAGANNS